MTEKRFKEKFMELSFWDKIGCYNEFAMRKNQDYPIFNRIDEQFFVDNFQSYMSLAENIGKLGIDMDNEVIFFDFYGDLATLSREDAEEAVNQCVCSIYDYPDIWANYIDED